MITDNGFKMSVIAASRHWGNDMNDTNNPVLAQNFGYEYDPIGNRVSANGGTRSVASAYTANNLNQYTERAVSGTLNMLGSAMEDAFVTVSLTNGTPEPVDRQGKYWHKALEVDNTLSAVYPEIKVVGVYNPQSVGIPDVVSEESGRKFIAKTPEQFTYDADGNMTSDGRYTYTWDAENRLIAVETESRSGVPAAFMKRLTFQYDYMSRRISKKLYRRQGQDWASAPQKEIAYIYDGWNLICESIRETKSAGGGGGGPPPGKGKGQGQQGPSGGGSVSISTNYYIWGLDLSGTLQGAGGIGGLLSITKLPSTGGVGGGSFFPCYDGNGNITDYISTNGTISAHYEYSPFGETIVSTGSRKDAFPFRFSTKYTDAETALVYYGYRYYSPTLGRWINRDPIGEQGGRNLYAFVENDPLDKTDPLGHSVTVTTELVDYHGSVEVWIGSLLIYYLKDPVPRVTGNYSKSGVSIQSGWGNTWAWVKGSTAIKNLPWWLPGVDKLQLSSHVMANMKICGCCDSGKVKVDWTLKAQFKASASGGSGSAKAEFDGKVLITMGIDADEQKPDSKEYTLPAGGCITKPFEAVLAWQDADTSGGTGISGRASVSASAQCSP